MLTSRHMVEKLDRSLAIAGLVAGLVAIPFLKFVAPDYIGMGIALTVACAIYLVLRKRKGSWELSFPSFDSSTLRLLINILFFALLGYSLILLHSNTYDRPLAYFISIALMSTLVTLEIFTMPKEKMGYTVFILTKILLIAFSLRWSLYYMFPGSLFGSDPWDAVYFYARVSEAGHLSRNILGTYYYMPIQHIAVVITSQLTQLDFRSSMFFSLGLFEIISLIFVFLLGNKLFGKKVGLLATLLLAVNNLHIMWGWWIVAQTLGLSLATFVLFLVLRPTKGNAVEFKVISLLVMILMIFTHHLSSAITLVMLAFLFIGYWIFPLLGKNAERFAGISITTVLFFGTSLAAYSIYVSRIFGSFAYIAIGSGEIRPFPELIAPVVATNPFWFELNRLGPLVFYALAVIGILSMLNSRNMNLSRFSLAFCGASLTALVFAGFLLPHSILSFARWFVFLQMLLVIPVALGLVFICSVIKKNWQALSMLGAITFLLISLMVFNTQGAFDSPIYPKYVEPRRALTESELYAAGTIQSNYAGTLTTDSYYVHAFKHIPKLIPKQFTPFDVQTGFADVDGLLLFREYSIENLMMVRGAEGYYKIAPGEFHASLVENKFSRVYESGAVSGYHKEGSASSQLGE